MSVKDDDALDVNDLHQKQVALLRAQNECLLAALGELPLSMRLAISNRDLDACRAWAKRGEDFTASLQQRAARAEMRATELAVALQRVLDTRHDPHDDVDRITLEAADQAEKDAAALLKKEPL